jgi:hypothetical protein
LAASASLAPLPSTAMSKLGQGVSRTSADKGDLMTLRSKGVLAGLTAALLMGLAVSATASRLSISNTRFRITWNEVRFGAGEVAIQQTCRLTLEGSFHSATIRKTPGGVIGAVTRAMFTSENCRSNNFTAGVTVLSEALPWHLTYERFAGVLPTITELTVLLRGYAWRFHDFLGLGFCLYRDEGRPEENLAGAISRDITTGALSTITLESGRRIRLFRGIPLPESCVPTWEWTGNGQMFLLGNTSRISVTLI